MIVSLLADFIHVLKILILGNYIWGYGRKDKRILLEVLGFTAIASFSIQNTDNVNLRIVLYLIYSFLVIKLVYNNSFLKTFFGCVWIVTFISVIDKISGILVNLLFVILKYNNRNIYIMLTNGITALLLLLIYVISDKYRKKATLTELKWWIAILLITIVDSAVLVFIGGNVEESLSKTGNVALGCAFILAVVGVFAQILMVFMLVNMSNIYKDKQLLTEKYLDEQINHYNYLEQKEQETKRFRHDIRAHMNMMSTYLNDQRYDDLKKYLEAINGEVEKIGNSISVNNGIADAVINKYYAEAVRNNIEFKVKGHFPLDFSMEPFDICTVFSNLLDNAFEAVKKVGNRKISLTIRYTENQVIMVLINEYSGDVNEKSGELYTSKSDKQNHGFGLENVKRSIEKNRGFLDISKDEHFFKVTIVFDGCRKE